MNPAPPQPAPANPATAPAVPRFRQALSGLWLLTWKSGFTWRRSPLWLAVLIANPLLAWLTIPTGRTSVFLDWTVHLYLELLLPLYCLVVSGALIRDEVQDDTLGFLVTRPVTRARLYLGKYLCQLVWLEAVALVNGLLLAAAGAARDIAAAGALAPRVLLAGALAALVYSALGALFGLLTRRYIVLGLVYGFLVEIGIGHIPTNVNSLSMMRHVHTLLANHAAVRERFDWTAEGTATSILVMLAAAALSLAAGAVLFTWKEFHAAHDAPR